MATNTVRPVTLDRLDYPTNFIVWLDKYIGDPKECIFLKTRFFMAMDPTSGLFERELNKDDVNNSILYETAIKVQLNNVEFMFQAFVDVEKCFTTIENNIEKRIIVITSGSKGRILVPTLAANFEETFGPHNRIYIFCANMLMQEMEGVPPPTNTWALGFLGEILMFNHQDDLLSRVVSDLADHFQRKGRDYDEQHYYDPARQHYEWAKLMYKRFEALEPANKRTKEIREIEQSINDLNERRNLRRSDEDDDVPMSTENDQ